MTNIAVPAGSNVLRHIFALIKARVIRHPADRLGAIRAQISAIREQEKKIENELKALGPAEHNGVLYRAVVSKAHRDSVDWQAIASKFEVSPQLRAAHTTHLEYLALRLSPKLKGG